MKSLFFTTSIVLLISVIISASLSAATANSNSEIINPPQPVTYIVKDYNGKIAVFENGSDTPFRITDTYTKNLPQEDKMLLSEGIYIDNDKDLALLLADYCS